tara:strand:- start:11622 stop:12596 length:975 start_codon:yes stop_codon:yes gene_type:complete
MALFDVNDNVRKVTATANGNLVDFDFNFQVNATTDIDVALDGVAKQLTSDYTIVTSAGAAGLNADGTGTVRFNSAPANNVTVSIKSDVPLSRASVYTSGGNITAASLEADFDRIVMALGDADETLNRSLKAPVNDPADVDMTLPKKETRKGKLLGFDATSGDPVIQDAAVSSASVSNVTTGAPGSAATATATYNSTTGAIDFTFGLPQGAQGAAGNNGVFNAIATQLEAQTGTENTKGMTPLRVKEAINAQVSGISAVASKFFGVKKIVETTSGVGRTILQQEHTLVGGSENLVLSDYETYFFATGSVGLTLRSSDGHLLIDLP